jgi:ADP-heptose:LPS heptosyltransferase
VDRNLSVGALLGFTVASPSMSLHVRQQERQDVDRILAAAGVDWDHRMAVVFPAARWETKQWLAERFAEVADRITDELGLRVVLLGGPDEVDRCATVARACRTAVLNLAGQTGIRQMVALIERAAVVLCHDSAPMHFAVALRRPMVACLGPTHPARTGPYQRLQDVLRRDLACSPCYLRRLDRCPHQHRCMTELSVEMVLARVRAVV